MSFQTVFDRAESISMIKSPVVGQTVTRNNVVRSVNRGGDIWRFEVSLPDGIEWTVLRSVIATMEALDKHTVSSVQINRTGYNDWLTTYTGDSASTTGFQVTATSGNTATIIAYPAGHGLTTSDITFKAGDIMQFGSGRVYAVAADVVYPNTTITLNRPIIDAGTFNLTIGPDVTWDVICVEFPKWSIFQQNQVAWGGAFVFYEDMT